VFHVCEAEVAVPDIVRHRIAVCGSGLTEAEAEQAAWSEAIERFCLYFHDGVQLHRGGWEKVAAHAIHPSSLMLYSESQQRAKGGYRFSEDTGWVEARSAITGSSFLVPARCCYLGYPRGPESNLCRADSNGCAAGPDHQTAVARAFLEAVERDAIALWWYNRLRRPPAPLPGSLGPGFRAALTGLNLELLNITTDLRIPVVAAIAVRSDGSQVWLGFGADWDLERASWRAIRELSQVLANPGFVVGGSLLRKEAWLVPDATIRPPECGRFGGASAVEDCIETAVRAGLDVLVIDHTRPDVKLRVARVIVPGLRPAVPRFAPGRLYDAPVRLGWMDRPFDETCLNPIPFDL
jgi:ribosomal protein S12 methylthiotransferase accessory factor